MHRIAILYTSNNALGPFLVNHHAVSVLLLHLVVLLLVILIIVSLEGLLR
jgi:hypothetical protein